MGYRVVLIIGAALAIIVGIVILAIVFLGFPGITDNGLAGPPGGELFAGAVTVIPSDKDGGIEYGDRFTVETIGQGIQPKGKKPNPCDEPARIKDVKFEKISEREDGMITIQLTYKLVPEKSKFSTICSRVFITTGPPEFKKIKSDISSCDCSIYRRDFSLFPEDGRCSVHNYPKYKTSYVRITSYTGFYELELPPVYTPFYKVSYI